MAVRMWRHGRSATEIANQLGRVFMLSKTRSAVIGKMDRLGVLQGQRPDLKDRQQRLKMLHKRQLRADKIPREVLEMVVNELGEAPVAPNPYRSAPLPTVAPTPLGLNIFELEAKHCRWPVGDGPFSFCGHERRAGSSYCWYHERLSHTTSSGLRSARKVSY
jgi:GcrA cell cycle regulator